MSTIDRRRFLTIAASAMGAALITRPVLAAANGATVWHGQAMGAPTQLILNHPDPARAAKLVRQVAAELARLERIFTLYRDGSELVTLNRSGVLVAPSPEMVDALLLSRKAHQATAGLFDPSVQPVWVAYAGSAGQKDIGRARDFVGFADVHVSRDRIALRSGMKLTLNGMAQGFITDRIVDMLRAEGAEHTLVDMGEIRAIDGRTPTEPWRVALDGGGEIELRDRAVATTEPSGYRFPDGDPHLIDPFSGKARSNWQRLAVIAPEAGLADALSTGFCLSDGARIRDALASLPGVEVRALDAAGQEFHFG